MSEKVTIAEIARACGVSIGTVDRALNNRSGINAGTRAAVLDKAEKMGYKTNKLAAALSRKSSKRIAVIYPSAPADFYRCMEIGIRKASEDISIFGVETESFRYGVSGTQDEQRLLEDTDWDDFDAIALDPLNPDSSAFVRRLAEAGKPTALFNNDLPDSGRIFFVGADSVQAGRIGADILGSLLSGEGSAAVLGNYLSSMPFVDRYKGFCRCMEEHYPKIKTVCCRDCRHDDAATEKNIIDFLSSCDGRKGIFCTSYSCTLAAVKALEKLNTEAVQLVGFDVSEVTARAVRKGKCRALIYQDPYRQAYKVVELLSKHILEGWRAEKKEILIPSRIAFRENIGDFADGIIREDLEI